MLKNCICSCIIHSYIYAYLCVLKLSAESESNNEILNNNERNNNNTKRYLKPTMKYETTSGETIHEIASFRFHVAPTGNAKCNKYGLLIASKASASG